MVAEGAAVDEPGRHRGGAGSRARVRNGDSALCSTGHHRGLKQESDRTSLYRALKPQPRKRTMTVPGTVDLS